MSLSFDSKIKWKFIKPNNEFLLLIESQTASHNIFEWVERNRALLEKCLIQYGGILLRSFNTNPVSDFNKLIQKISPNLLDYVYRSAPRTRLGGKIFTATEYPVDRIIPLHNENS